MYWIIAGSGFSLFDAKPLAEEMQIHCQFGAENLDHFDRGSMFLDNMIGDYSTILESGAGVVLLLRSYGDS